MPSSHRGFTLLMDNFYPESKYTLVSTPGQVGGEVRDSEHPPPRDPRPSFIQVLRGNWRSASFSTETRGSEVRLKIIPGEVSFLRQFS